ncbi:MAG: integrase arm-type DNA-binding domain-containing protein [Reyranellaceae bacterium]
MPKKAAGLTARRIQSIATPGMFADGNGLYLQVAPSGSKSWVFRFQINGRRRDMGLGSLDVLGLADAREKAVTARRLVANGLDPIEQRATQKAAVVVAAAKSATFRQAAEACIESMRASWRNAKHSSQWSSTLESYVYPTFGHLPVSAIDTTLVCKVLDPIWHVKTETASRVRGRIETVLHFAKVRGQRDGENPARWHGHLEFTYPAKGEIAPVQHHASLPYSDMPAFWPKLQVQDGLGARALEFTVLTAARTGEVLGARWSEFDLDAKSWRIPGERMKAGREHVVPLSDPALGLLRKLDAVRLCGFVFPGGADRPLSNMVMHMTLRRMKVDVTPHGFRSTFRTWVAEQTNFPADVAEVALAHTQDDKVVAAYQRGDFAKKRAALMTAWANYVEGRSAKVTSIARAARR